MKMYSKELDYRDLYDKGTIGRESKFFSFLVAFFLMLSVYLVPFATSISVGEVILCLSFVFLAIMKRKVVVYQDIWLTLFLLFSVIVTIMIPSMLGLTCINGLTRLLRDSFYYACIYIFVYSYVDFNCFKKWVKIFCVLLSGLICIQFLAYLFVGILIPGILPNSIVASSNSLEGIYQHALVSAARNGYLKAMGFLTEGAHCAQALTIGIIICFDFDDLSQNTKRTYYTIVFLSIGSVLTFSATGLAFTALVWGIIFYRLIRSKKVSKEVLLILLFCIIGVGVFIAIGDSFSLGAVLDRITSAAGQSTADNSSFYRIYKGFEFWNGLPFLEKIIGIGFGNYNDLSFLAKGVAEQYLQSEYMNSFSYILVSSGVFGFLLYFLHMCTIYRHGNRNAHVMLFVLVIMTLTSSPYSSVYWVWMMTIAIFNIKENICIPSQS